MKTRRALQKIVGVLSLFVVVCLIIVSAWLAILNWFPKLSDKGNEFVSTVKNGFGLVASFVGLKGMSYLVPCVAVGLPTLLLLLSGVLLFTRDNGKNGKYNAALILALIGMVVLSVFAILFATDLLSGATKHNFVAKPLSWTSLDTIVRLVFAGLLVLFLVFASSALAIKPKKASTEKQAAVVETTTPPEQDQPVEKEQVKKAENNPAPNKAKDSKAKEVGFKSYVPETNVTVHNVVENTYGNNSEELTADVLEKINKVRALYDMGAITKEEYIKIVNVYLNKK